MFAPASGPILFVSLSLAALSGEPPAGAEATPEPGAEGVVEAAESEPAPAEPAEPDAGSAGAQAVPEPVAPSGANGGFGQVGGVTVESDVRELPPTPVVDEDGEPGETEGPGFEISARAEAGYAQTHVGNAAGLDHHGLFLRLHLALFPWIAKSGVVGAGLGIAYSYQGLNRGSLPVSAGFDSSSAQQQSLTVSGDLLVRPHPEWFSFHLSPMFGMGWYANARELFAAGRPARISSREYAFVGGGSLALCTAWDIACVSGGSEILLDVATTSPTSLAPIVIDPWGWHLALGVDIMRILARANRGPA